MFCLGIGIVILLVLGVLAVRVARGKNVDLILKHVMTRRRERFDGIRHVFFCLADHFEPFWRGADREVAIDRVERWYTSYPSTVDCLRDKGGRVPQHAFFYPAEEYHPRCVAMLSELERKDFGSVEVHLHHDRDTSEGFRQRIIAFKNVLSREHGLLHRNTTTGEIEYAFIHGMFALDDSGPGGKWCGVKDEITILKETGCYADFTFPSAPDSTQPPIINRIYYATDDPVTPKSHFKGTEAEFGKGERGDLLMITGPLAIDWYRRNKGFIPGIENGALASDSRSIPSRVDRWIRVEITVKGWPNWIFVKVHTHGAQEPIAASLLGGGLKSLYSHLLRFYNDGDHYVLHFVRPREIFYCVKALETANLAWIKRIEQFDYRPPTQSCPGVTAGDISP